MKYEPKHENTDRNRSRNWNRRIMAATLVLLTVSGILMARYVFAWFSNRRALDTLSEIELPYRLDIKGGHKSDMTMIDLQGIDLSAKDADTKDFVFCICGAETQSYIIELAHTTNIPFVYRIYGATEVNTEPSSGSYASATVDGINYYYTYSNDTLISGSYLNKDAGTGIALPSGDYHNGTYDSYTNVQKNAEPLYWLPDNSFTVTPSAPDSNGYTFYDYYVLQVDWSGLDSSFESAKESDMLYLLAENAVS